MSENAAQIRPSDIVRQIRRGDQRIISSSSSSSSSTQVAETSSTRQRCRRLRVTAYRQAIATLGWRDLGVLLAQLAEPLELEMDMDAAHRLVGALAIAVIHILDTVGESGLSAGPVNSGFAAAMFGTMVRACGRCVGQENSGREEDGAWVVGLVVRSVARSLDRGGGTGAAPFDRDAVLAGITAGGFGTKAAGKDPLRPPDPKRQRSADPPPAATSSSLAAVLASALRGHQSGASDGRRLTAAQKCAVRILRASGNHVIRHLADEVGRTGATDSNAIAVKALTALCCALVACGSDAAVREQQQQQQQQQHQCLGAGNQDRIPDDNGGDGSLLTGDLFACIRDTVPLVPVPSSVRSSPPGANAALDRLIDSVSALASTLVASVFRPLLVAAPNAKQNTGTGTAAADDNDDPAAAASAVPLAPIYAECVGSRGRCYQWAALCRMATWLSGTEPLASSTAPLGRVHGAGPSLAAGRLCWLQILSSSGVHQTPGARTTMAAVWLLLLSESLAHVLGTYPQQQQQKGGGSRRRRRPLFVQTEESQIRVFSAVASLLSMLPHQLRRCLSTAAETTPAAASLSSLPVLLYSCVSSCEQLLLLVRPQAASMGLFWLHGASGTVGWRRRQRGEGSEPEDGGGDDGSSERDYEDGEAEGGVLGDHGTSIHPASYVFGPPLLQQQRHDGTGGGRRLGDPDGLAADLAAGNSLERRASEESQHEARIAGVFVGLDRALQEITTAMPSDGDAGGGGGPARPADARQQHRVLAVCVRTALLWMRMFAAGARDNAGRQMRILEALPSSGAIWINSSRIIVHKPATDWARLQRIPVASGSTGTGTGTAGVYRPAVARVLRFLMALAAWPFLAAPTRRDVIAECLRQTPASTERDAAADSNEAGAGAGRLAHSQCRGLASVLAASPRELGALAFAALQTLASIGGVRVRLLEEDPSRLRPPHVQVRDRAPPSSEALTHLAMRAGGTRLLLHPQLLAHATTSRARCLAPDGSSRPFVALQMWLDLIGSVVRHSFFRSFLGARRFARWWCLALAASARHLAGLDTRRKGSDAAWLRMALTLPMHLASWQQYLPTSGGAVSGLTHLLPRPPAAAAAANSNASSSSGDYWDAKLFGWLAALDQQLMSGVLEAPSTPGADGPATLLQHPRSVLRIVYFCACRLWLSVPLLLVPSGSSTQQQQQPQQQPQQPPPHPPPMALRVCRDVWGVAAEMLQLLTRLLRHPAVHRRFVAPRSGLVDDFGSVLSTLALGPACYPSVVADILRPSSPADDGKEDGGGILLAGETGDDDEEEDDGGGRADLITIPLFDSPDQAAASAGADGGGSDGDGGAQESVIERLLRQAAAKRPADSAIRHARGSATTTLDDYYSRRMQRALWTNYTSQLQQQLPSILLFSRPTPTTAAATMASEPADQQQESLLLPAALDEAGNACDGACASDSAHGRHHADATRWLVDSDNTLRRLLAPLVQSANHRRLARRSHLAALWNAVACWFPQQCVLRTIAAAAAAAAAATQKHSQQQRLHPATEAEAEAEAAPLLLFQRMCVSAAFLLPPPLSDGTSSSTVASVLECLVAQLVAEAAEDEENSNNGNNGNGNGNGRGDGGGRGAAAHDALLFLAWRHRDKVLHKVAVCARRLDRAAGMAVSKLAEAWGDGGKDQRTVIMLSGYHREDEATVAANAAAGNPSADSDSAPALTPIPLALAFLVGQSRVFRAMLTGPFREAEAVVRTSEASSMGQTAPCSLHCSHATLTDLVAIVRRCAMSSGGSHNGRSPDLSQLAAQLEVLYSAGRLASALHLAVVYDLRHLAVLLLWFFVDRLGRGIVPDPARRSDDLACLWLFSLLYRDNGAVSDALDSIGEAAAAVDALGAAVLLCLDQVDTLDVVGSNADLFVSTLRFVLLDSE